MRFDDKYEAIVFDANCLYARAYFSSVKTGACTTVSGLRILLGILSSHRANSVIFCWDGQAKSIKPRVDKPSDYVPNREDFMASVTTVLGIPQAVDPLSEADDLVASYVHQLVPRGKVLVVSADKDLMQVVRPGVDYYDIGSKRVLTLTEINGKFGTSNPLQVAFALAIIGDPGDGIVGVRGWGHARARDLLALLNEQMSFLECFEVLSNVLEYKHPAKAQEFYTSLEMTLLKTDMELSLQPADITWIDPDDLPPNLEPIKQQYTMAQFNWLDGENWDGTTAGPDEVAGH